jgi:hypothetical protein
VTKEGLTRLLRPIAAAVVALVLLGAAPCEGVFGDRGIAVVFVNGTSHRVIVYPDGRAYPSVKVPLDPGAEQPNALLISSSERESFVGRVEATDEADTIVFCHDYTLGELQDLHGRIVVRDNELCVAR